METLLEDLPAVNTSVYESVQQPYYPDSGARILDKVFGATEVAIDQWLLREGLIEQSDTRLTREMRTTPYTKAPQKIDTWLTRNSGIVSLFAVSVGIFFVSAILGRR